VTYTVEDLRERLDEILEQVRAGKRVEILENGREIAWIQGVKSVSDPHPFSREEVLRQLEEEGIIIPPSEPRGELVPVVDAPGTLAEFLESRR
jgi:prevent-host-death family protein